MPGQSFRFLHAANFHLEETLRGVPDVPEHLLDTLVNAPCDAAEEVFEAALREEVDFVVLSGDLLDPTSAGPRAVAFLAEQFEKMRQRDIPVYWAASELDSTQEWLASITWPANVRVFASDAVESITHLRSGAPIVRLLGRSWHQSRPIRASEFSAEQSDLFCLAVLPHDAECERASNAVRYWALGGETQASANLTNGACAHSPGRPQGTCVAESGPHGCTIVHVDAGGEIRTRMIPSDAVRWCDERIHIHGGVSRDTIRSELRTRVAELVAAAGRPVLIAWKVSGIGRFDSLFAQRRHREEMLAWLRREFGHSEPAAWSVSLELDAPHALRTEWCEEDSILGDYMRVLQAHQEEDEQPIDVSWLLPGRHSPSGVSLKALTEIEPERDAILNQVAVVGLDLLRGDDTLPHSASSS